MADNPIYRPVALLTAPVTGAVYFNAQGYLAA